MEKKNSKLFVVSEPLMKYKNCDEIKIWRLLSIVYLYQKFNYGILNMLVQK